jgi:sulfonate transport system permease protein
LRATNLNPVIAPGPLETLGYLFVSSDAEAERQLMWHALSQTLPVALLGMLAGLAAAFVLAALTTLKPKLANAVLPLAMVTQCTPLIALVPFMLMIFGRGTTASVFMAILVVFFPAFVMLSQGFELVPRAAGELVQAYGGNGIKKLVMISVPYATPYLFAAAKLVVPRALLGVMLAEWLLTGVGLGGLIELSRGNLDYGMVWAGALISILISITAYQVIDALERAMRW